MAIAISPSAAASLTSGFSYPAQSVFRFLSLARSNRADHPRSFEVRHCGDAAQALSSDACAEPMIRALRASGVREYYERYFAAAGGLVSYGSDSIEQFRLAAGYVAQAQAQAQAQALWWP
jgi:hypothetical protein